MSQNKEREGEGLHEAYALSFSLTGQNMARDADARVSWAIGRFDFVNQITKERPDDVFARSSGESIWKAVFGRTVLIGNVEVGVFRDLLVSAALANELQEDVAYEAKAAMDRLGISIDDVSSTLSPDAVLPRIEETGDVDPDRATDLLHRAFQNLTEVELVETPLVSA